MRMEKTSPSIEEDSTTKVDPYSEKPLSQLRSVKARDIPDKKKDSSSSDEAQMNYKNSSDTD